jgi:hypothetical protein
MARPIRRLTAITVKNAKRPGLYSDGAGLYLQVGPAGNKSWIFRYALRGREHHHGLGALHTVTLQEARESALHCRRLLLTGVDPIETKQAEKAAHALKQHAGIHLQGMCRKTRQQPRGGLAERSSPATVGAVAARLRPSHYWQLAGDGDRHRIRLEGS